MIPAVTPLDEADLGPGVADHERSGDRMVIRQQRQRRIDIGFERHALAAAQAFVGSDDEAALAALDPACERLGREAAEHNRMDRAQPRAGEHGDDALEDHGHVDRHALALGDADRLQRIGHGDGFGLEFAIGEAAPGCSGIVRLEDQRNRVAARLSMAVDRIVAKIELAVGEPGDVDRVV